MPRKARIISKSEIYHIVIRGNNKQNLFYYDQDYSFFLKRLSKYIEETNIELYAYCLMTNHVHLMIGKASRINLITFMKKLEVSYAYYFNTKYERTGHLFQDRYKSEPISSKEQFQRTIRYILRNPIKGGLSNSINYRWSSYELSLHQDKLINLEFLKLTFGNMTNYTEFVNQKCTDDCMDYENLPRKTDYSCLSFLKRNYKIRNPLLIDKFSPNSRRKILIRLKENGYSIRCISRLTGISRKIIQLA